MKFISKFDHIGPKPQLYIKKQVRYASFTGGLLTIILGILSILVFIGSGYNLFTRKNPTAFLSKEINDYPRINSTEAFFLFAPQLPLGIRLFDENFDKKFMFKFRYIDTDGVSDNRKTNSTIYTDYEMVPCLQTQRFQANYYNVTHYLKLPPEDYRCIPDNMTIPLLYKFGNAKFGIYNVILDFCAKLSKNPSSCYSIEEVRKMHSKFYLHFIYLDSFVDSKNYENPVKYIYNSDLTLGNTNSQRQDNYYFRNIQLFTDLAWIMEDYNIQSTFQFSQATNSMVSPAVEPLLFYLISVDNIKDVYYRKYLKLQEVLANAGGFIKFCSIVVLFLNNFLTSKSMLQSIYLSLLKKYESKIQFNSNESNNQVNVFNIKSQNSKIIKNINNNVYNSSLFTRLNKDKNQLNIIPKNKILDFDPKNPFTKQKNEYKKITCQDKICFCSSKLTNQESLKVIKFIEDDLISSLSVENLLFVKNFHERKNKLLYGENGYKLLKIIFLLKYLQFHKKENNQILSIKKMLENFDLESYKEDFGNYKLILQNYVKNNLN